MLTLAVAVDASAAAIATTATNRAARRLTWANLLGNDRA
jgi:hypothetical protein